MNLKHIAQGFINATKAEFGNPDSVIEARAESRYAVCLTCEVINDEKTYCSKDKGGCGCKLSWKTRSDSQCPKNLW